MCLVQCVCRRWRAAAATARAHGAGGRGAHRPGAGKQRRGNQRLSHLKLTVARALGVESGGAGLAADNLAPRADAAAAHRLVVVLLHCCCYCCRVVGSALCCSGYLRSAVRAVCASAHRISPRSAASASCLPVRMKGGRSLRAKRVYVGAFLPRDREELCEAWRRERGACRRAPRSTHSVHCRMPLRPPKRARV